jgi:hypothetical protein
MADIFLSYSSIDDTSPPDGGWVKAFHQAMTDQLAVVTGVRYDIWLDTADYRQNNDTTTILGDAAAARILISIVSPGHAGSHWCRDELRAFLRTGQTDRVFKIRKVPLSQAENLLLEPELRAPLKIGYQFHTDDRAPRTFTPDSSRLKEHYHTTLNEVVYDIKALLARGRSVKLALFGNDDSAVLREVRRSTRVYAPLPTSGLWPASSLPRAAAIREALDECELVVMAFEPGTDPAQEALFNQVMAHPKVRRCLVWLHGSPTRTEDALFDRLLASSADKCEISDGRKLPSTSPYVEAVVQMLQYLERNPLPSSVPWDGQGVPRSRVHVVYPSDETAWAQAVFADAVRHRVQTFDSPVNSLELLTEQAATAEAMLIASTSETYAAAVMKRVAPRLLTSSRGGVGFAQKQPLVGNFRYLGQNVQGVFANFPP